jgi:hypothetical protein
LKNQETDMIVLAIVIALALAAWIGLSLFGALGDERGGLPAGPRYGLASSASPSRAVILLVRFAG